MRAAVLVLACLPTGSLADPVGAFLDLDPHVYVLGEVHDNPGHHLLQAEVIEMVFPTAIVWEMLTPDQAARVTEAGSADPVALGWEESGWPDFALYAPVFDAAAGLPAYGGALPRDEVRRSMTESPAAILAEIDPRAPDFGLDAPLDPAEQAAREAEQLSSHCDALPADVLPGFVAAQRLRDAFLASQVLEALEDHGPPVALITGNGHARSDRGVPALLALAEPDLRVASLGQFEDAVPEGSHPFDVTAASPAAERPDPCAAFEQG